MFEFFLIVWGVYSALCILAFVWGCVRGWEIEILVPPAFFIIGSGIWWVLYLVLDKINQHVTIH